MSEVTFREAKFKVGFVNRVEIRMIGQSLVGTYKLREGEEKTASPIYAFKCPIHGLVANYPKGYGERLECPICEKEALTRSKNAGAKPPRRK